MVFIYHAYIRIHIKFQTQHFQDYQLVVLCKENRVGAGGKQSGCGKKTVGAGGKQSG